MYTQQKKKKKLRVQATEGRRKQKHSEDPKTTPVRFDNKGASIMLPLRNYCLRAPRLGVLSQRGYCTPYDIRQNLRVTVNKLN